MTENNTNPQIENDAMTELLRLQALAKRNQVQGETKVSAYEIKPKAPAGIMLGVTTNAVLESNQISHYGRNDCVKVTFQPIISDPAYGKDVEITATYWKSNSEKSRYYKILSKLLQKDARKGFHINELIGVTCEIEITHNHVENGAYANVTDVKRIEVDNEASITL